MRGATFTARPAWGDYTLLPMARPSMQHERRTTHCDTLTDTDRDPETIRTRRALSASFALVRANTRLFAPARAATTESP